MFLEPRLFWSFICELFYRGYKRSLNVSLIVRPGKCKTVTPTRTAQHTHTFYFWFHGRDANTPTVGAEILKFMNISSLCLQNTILRTCYCKHELCFKNKTVFAANEIKDHALRLRVLVYKKSILL